MNNNNNNKVIAIVIGAIVALFALSLLMRFVLLSEYGLPGGWILFGLPAGAIGVLLVLLRLGLLHNLLDRSGTLRRGVHINGVQMPPPPSSPPAAWASQRLQELDILRISGAISEMEYTAKRQRILTEN